jgi:hypothetical protein
MKLLSPKFGAIPANWDGALTFEIIREINSEDLYEPTIKLELVIDGEKVYYPPPELSELPEAGPPAAGQETTSVVGVGSRPDHKLAQSSLPEADREAMVARLTGRSPGEVLARSRAGPDSQVSAPNCG